MLCAMFPNVIQECFLLCRGWGFLPWDLLDQTDSPRPASLFPSSPGNPEEKRTPGKNRKGHLRNNASVSTNTEVPSDPCGTLPHQETPGNWSTNFHWRALFGHVLATAQGRILRHTPFTPAAIFVTMKSYDVLWKYLSRQKCGNFSAISPHTH